MTEEELRAKIDKLEESKSLQEEKVLGISESLEKLRTRHNKEITKLNAVTSEIDKCKGRLGDMILLEYGITSLNELEKVLKDLRDKKKADDKSFDNADKNKKENVTNETKNDVT
ncbi:MAG: hypothetical protein J5517_07405 [Eubacterium sp.]|nr:hypothetical protein [Eubacterium sp.]